jgi:predicted lipoprotein
LLDSVLAGIEIAKNDKLADALGLTNDLGIPQPFAVEAWRSRYSLPLIAATVDGARQLYFAGTPGEASFGIDDLLRAKGADELAGNIERQFERVVTATPTDLVLFDAVSEAAHSDELAHYYEAMTVLAQLLKNDVPPVLGVTLGFNEKDGD